MFTSGCGGALASPRGQSIWTCAFRSRSSSSSFLAPDLEVRRLRCSFPLCARMHGERELDFLPETAEDRHQPVDGETAKIDVANAHKLAVRDSRFSCRLPARHILGIEDFDDLRGQ